MKYTECPVCGSKNLDSFLTVKGYRISEEQFVVDQCLDCSFKLTNPLPDENDIGKYYESENYISHTSSKKGLFDMAYQLVRNWAIRSKLNLVSSSADKGLLVDYGCGTGSFLSFAKKKNWEVKGFEPSAIAISNAEPSVKPFIEEPDALSKIEDNSVAAFTMWHVFEHVYHPNDLLLQIKSKLKDTGTLIIAVPNHDSLDAQIYKENWAAWDVPIHHSHFNKKSMKHILEKNGFALKEVKEMPFDAYYISLLSEELASGSKNVFKAVKNGFKSNKKGYKGQNTSSLIYVAQPL